MKRKKQVNHETAVMPTRLAAIVANALNLYAGTPANLAMTPQQVNQETLAVIGRELVAQHFSVAGVPIPGDLRAFIFGLVALKALAGYQPEWADQLASSLNLQREGIARLFIAAARDLSSYRFEHDWERSRYADPAPGQAARLVPVNT